MLTLPACLPGVVGPEEVWILLLQLLPDQLGESWLHTGLAVLQGHSDFPLAHIQLQASLDQVLN